MDQAGPETLAGEAVLARRRLEIEEGKREVPVKVGIGSLRGRKVRILGALLFVTLGTGCYGGGWGGGSPGWWGGRGSPVYSNNYYSNNVYRGYGSYPQPGLFGGYAPAHEAWAASTRGRTSYGREGEPGGQHVVVVHGSGGSVGHSGGTGGGGEHRGGSGQGH